MPPWCTANKNPNARLPIFVWKFAADGVEHRLCSACGGRGYSTMGVSMFALGKLMVFFIITKFPPRIAPLVKGVATRLR